jgi:hypothetical protein
MEKIRRLMMKKRKLTVSRVYQPSRRPGPVASIRLTGRWLEKLGFEIGGRFLVRESPGRIELVASDADRSEAMKEERV